MTSYVGQAAAPQFVVFLSALALWPLPFSLVSLGGVSVVSVEQRFPRRCRPSYLFFLLLGVSLHGAPLSQPLPQPPADHRGKIRTCKTAFIGQNELQECFTQPPFALINMTQLGSARGTAGATHTLAFHQWE